MKQDALEYFQTIKLEKANLSKSQKENKKKKQSTEISK